MLPISISGVIKSDIAVQKGLHAGGLRDEIASGLTMEQAMTVTKDDNKVDFGVGLFRPFWWKLLVGISDGKIIIHENSSAFHISYRLRFFNLIIWVTAIVFTVAALDRLFSPYPSSFLAFLFGWCWLILGNEVIINWKFRRFLRQCVVDAMSHSYYWHSEREPTK
jgi:hypothetical protein